MTKKKSSLWLHRPRRRSLPRHTFFSQLCRKLPPEILLPKNNIEYPQPGLPFHTINADGFSKLKFNLCDLTRKTDVVIQLYHEVFGKNRTYFLKRNRLSVAKIGHSVAVVEVLSVVGQILFAILLSCNYR
jgi:hypothetical protein